MIATDVSSAGAIAIVNCLGVVPAGVPALVV
jgi:hypothetical protein